MQLFKEEFSQSYTYDDKGNVISVQGLDDQNSAFEYNGSNDLIRATDAKGNKFNYTYDGNHNLLTAVSDSGMRYTFTYDSKGNPLTSKVGSATDYIQTSASYTNVGSFLSTMTDARGKSISCSYDTNKGLRTSVTDAKGATSSYSYDAMKRLTGLSQSVASGTAQVGYSYTNDDLTQVSHNGFTYGMTYDLFGNTLTTKVNSTTVSDNTYNYSRGLLTSTAYGNGLTVNYTYDDTDRVTEVKFGSTLMYSYAYDGDGNLQRMVDHPRGITTTYYYDLTGRLIRSVASDGSEYLYEYDLNNNLTKLHQKAAGSSWTTEYTYDKDNRPVTVKVGTRTITDSYNATGTRANRVYGFASPYTVTMTYLAGANGSKTAMLQSYRNGSDSPYTYTYDDNGNVLSITQGTVSASYVYDEINQLVRANDGFANRTTTYAYDLGGNITEKKEYAYTTGTLGTPTDTIAYGYDSAWKDKLVSYDGQAITYDEIGNPLTYRGYTLTWQGKRLQSLTGNGKTASYTYNEQGVRTSKTVNNVTTSYSYNGSLLMAQVTGSGSSQIKQLYSYDANGQLVSVNYNGTEYYYLRNGQNDIVGIMDSSGRKVVQYAYDSWGKLISTTGTLASTLGANNPFRYRGYYYDAETGLYYLMTRYYDPEVCRFISADVYMSTGQGILGGNMFAYCLNNPVNRYDEHGNSSLPNWAKVAIGAVVIIGLAVATVATRGAAAVVCGAALSGAIAGGATGAVSGAIAGGITEGWQGALDGACSGFMSGTLKGGATGALSAGINIATSSTTVVGNAHGSVLHKLSSNMQAGKMAASGRYSQVGTNKALKTMGLNGSQRPDVIGISKDGVNVIVKVVSHKQKTGYILFKMVKMLANNPGTKGKVVTWVRTIGKAVFMAK